MNRKSRWIRWVVAFAVIVVLYLAWAIFRPLPAINATGPRTLSLTTPDTVLAWPAAGQSAVGVTGTNILLAHGVQKPAPTASTAKLITCLLVLKQKPLSVGQQGPTITLTPGDVAIYNSYLAHAGSTVPVAAGEQISEYQMLEAILLPSANNMADSLAIWAFGSLPAYTAAANAWLKQQGLADTTIGSDASGYNPSTVSTAADLVRIGEMAMQDPVLAGIIGQTSAAGIPMAGTIKNVNLLVGTNNVVGVKTGNTDQAGGVFVGAIRTDVNQKPVTVVTALVGSPTLFQSMKDSLPLMQSAIANFQTDTPIHANQTLGSYKVPWGGTIQVKAARNLALTTWNGATITASLKLPPINVSATTSQPVGSVTATEPATSATSTQDVNLASTPKPPTLTWRLTHP